MANTTGQDLKNKVQGTAEHAADKAKDMASTVAERAQDAAGAVRDKAHDLGAAAGRRAEDATAAAGTGLRSLAGTLRDAGPHEGMLGSAKSAAADALDRTGRYVEQEGLSGMAGDLSELVRKNPIPALLIGIGFGFLLARFTSRS